MAKRCQENDAEIRKMILDAAERIGEEQGIDKITARRISNSIGYSTGVIYYHFQNKQEIMDLLSQNRNNDINETIQKCIHHNGTLRENSLHVMECIYQLVAFNRNTDVRLLMESSCDPEKDSPWLELTRYILDIAAKKGEIQSEGKENIAFGLCSFFVGYGLMLSKNWPQDQAAARCQADHIADALLQGFLQH